METSCELTVGQALQLFYKYGLTTLPVVNERSELIGTFEKSDAVGLSTLRSRLEEGLGSHLQRLMQPAGPAIETRLKRLLFEKSRTVPVIRADGRLSHFWHVGEQPIEGELPLPYRQLFMSLVESLHRPAAVVFQEPCAGEAASGPFLRRLALTRAQIRPWLESIRWRDGMMGESGGRPSGSAVAFHEDSASLPILLLKTPLALKDRHFGWIVEIREEYELASDVICSTGLAKTSSSLRKKVGAQGLRRVVNAFESYLIKKSMAGSEGDPQRLRGLLGVSRQSLRYKLKKHRLLSKRVREPGKG